MSQDNNEITEVRKGVFWVLALHVMAGLIYSLLVYYATVNVKAINSSLLNFVIYAVLGIGISQFVYIVPVIFLLYRQQEWGLMKGVIIGAVLTALLNGACWLLFTR